MNSKLLLPLLALAVFFSNALALADEEVCVACDRKVSITGDFGHRRAWGVTTIEGAGWRGEEAFREEIFGTNFTLSVSSVKVTSIAAWLRIK